MNSSSHINFFVDYALFFKLVHQINDRILTLKYTDWELYISYMMMREGKIPNHYYKGT